MENNHVTLYRKRHIPNETNNLKDDNIVKITDNLIITTWKALKPRKDIRGGASAYFLDKGYKVSKLIDHNGDIVCWYCDIIDTTYDKENNAYTFEDLLLDVLVYPDHRVKVVDADELALAYKNNMIDADKMCKALTQMDELLKLIYDGKFYTIIQLLDEYK